MHSKGGNKQDDHLFLNQLFYQIQIQLHVLYQLTNSLKIHSVLAIISKVSTLVAVDSDKFKLSYFLYIIYINIHTHTYIYFPVVQLIKNPPANVLVEEIQEMKFQCLL